MKSFTTLIVSLSLAACVSSPKQEREWIKDGAVVSSEEIQVAKSDCSYDEKIKESSELLGISISAGRYQSVSEAGKPDQYTNQAAALIKEAIDCMLEKGYSTREKSQ